MNQTTVNYTQLANDIKRWGRELGFQQVAIADTHLPLAEQRLNEWLAKGYYGEMEYMSRYGTKRSRPHELVPDTRTVVMVRMDYLPPQANFKNTLANRLKAYVARYALGRDYHKLIRKRLSLLAKKIDEVTPGFEYRPFADSAPVMEKPLAEKAGLGWIGKHTNLIHRSSGSWFFLGALFTNLPLPLDTEEQSHCGSCAACIDVCPTQAIVAPYQLDARRCISYLTIELRGSIPVEFRSMIGNRIYGCDDCQIVCPWNKFAKMTAEGDFNPRHELDTLDLIDGFNWTEEDFDKKTQGSAIRRIGYECWLRNLAVGLGNAPRSAAIVTALKSKLTHPSGLVREHVEWALQQHK